MLYSSDYETDGNTFKSRKKDNIVIVTFKDDFMLRSTDLSVRDRLLDFLNMVSKDDDVRSLVIMGSSEKKGCNEYYDFYQKILKKELGHLALLRMYNVINQLILKLVSLDKIVVHGNRGAVISLFLNLSLACDYRIVSENTVFSNPCLDLELLPKGGGPFFLSKMVGMGKALDILLSENPMSADQALEAGIVNQVVPDDNLEEALLEQAAAFAEKPLRSVIGIKRLLNYNYRGLKEYLEFENEELIKVFFTSEGWKELLVCR